MATSTSLTFRILGRYNGDGAFRRARNDIDRTMRHVDKASSGINTLTGRFKVLAVAMGTLGPALLPLANVAAGVGAAATAMAVSVASAVAIYGFAMKGAIQRTLDLAKAHGKLTASQSGFVNSVNRMKHAYQKFLDATQNRTLKTASIALDGVTIALKKLAPLVNFIDPSIRSVASAFKNWAARANGLQRFLTSIKNFGVPALDALLQAGRNVLAVLGFGFRAFLPLGRDLAFWLLKGSEALRKWAAGGGFERWIKTIKRDAPGVKAFLKQAWIAIRNLGHVASQFAPGALQLATAFAHMIAVLKPKQLAAISSAFLLWKSPFLWMLLNVPAVSRILTGLIKHLSPKTIMAIGIALLFLRTAIGRMVIAQVAALAIRGLAVAFTFLAANPVVAAILIIVAAIVLIATKTRWFQNIWNWAWGGIKKVASAVWGWIKKNWKILLAFIPGVGPLAFLIANWRKVWKTVANIAGTIWGWMKGAWRGVVRALKFVGGGIVSAWRGTWKFMAHIAGTIWGWMKGAWHGVVRALKFVGGGVIAAWRGAWKAVAHIAGTIWGWIKGAWHRLVGALKWAGGGFLKAWGGTWRTASKIAGGIWRGLIRGFKDVGTGFRNAWNWIVKHVFNPLKDFFTKKIPHWADQLWDGISKPFKKIKDLIGKVFGGAKGLFDKAKDIGGKILSKLNPANWFAQGGAVGQSQFVRVSTGEFVVQPAAVKKYGISVLDRINTGRFASGGPIGSGLVNGPGTEKSDSIMTALASGSYVVRAAAVRKYGSPFLAMLNSGLPNFASGGVVGLAAGGPATGGAAQKGGSDAPSADAVKGAKANTNAAITQIITPVVQLFRRTIPQAATVMSRDSVSKWNALKSGVGQAASNIGSSAVMIGRKWRDMKNTSSAQFNAMRASALSPMNTWHRNFIPKSADYMFGVVRNRWTFTKNAAAAQFHGMRGAAMDPMRVWHRTYIPRAADHMYGAVRNRWIFTKNAINAQHRALANGTYSNIKAYYTRHIPNWANQMRGGVVKAFTNMKNGVKATWGGIKGVTKEPVNWVISNSYGNGIRRLWNSVASVVFGSGKKQLPAIKRLATGGAVFGAGTSTSDSIPARLSAGEHVWTAKEVRMAGGHDVVAAMRRRIAGPGSAATRAKVQNVPGFASGGWLSGDNFTGSGVHGKGSVKFWGGALERGMMSDKTLPVMNQIVGNASTALNPKSSPLRDLIFNGMRIPAEWINDFIAADDAANSFANGYVPWAAWKSGDERRVMYHGKMMNIRTRAMLMHAEKIAKKRFSVPQGSYSNGSKSAGTHSGGGAIDTLPAIDKYVGALRGSGFASWRRTPKEGFSPHIHSIAVGDPTASGAAKAQVRDFFKGLNGLANHGPDTYMGGGGKGAARWAGLVSQVLRELGLSQSNVGNVIKAIAKESGGNPRSINNWDSNARAGHPSKGLLQVIASTFNSYAGKYKSLGVYNPHANIYAAIRYAHARYGAGWSARMARPGGYAMGGPVKKMKPMSFDKGGYLPPGLSLAYNGTGKPEAVGDSHGAVHIHGNVYVKNAREFQDMVVEAVSEAKRKGRM